MSIKRRFDVSLIAEIGAQGKTGPAELPAVALSEENRRSKFSTKDRELGRSERILAKLPHLGFLNALYGEVLMGPG